MSIAMVSFTLLETGEEILIIWLSKSFLYPFSLKIIPPLVSKKFPNEIMFGWYFSIRCSGSLVANSILPSLSSLNPS